MKEKLALLIIIFLAIVLRFYKFGETPPSLYWDEAAIGYNAYSILKTGADEYGEKFPVAFRSFDDYKPPLYIYLTVPSVAVFGLTEAAVRFPSAVAGVLMVVIGYLLVKTFFENDIRRGRLAAIAVAFSLAVSPWAIHVSRVAFEANLCALLIMAAVYFFLKSVRASPFYFILSILFFILSLYAYHSARLFVPFLIIVLGFIYRRELFKIKKTVVLAFLLGAILATPMAITFFSPKTQGRVITMSVFSYLQTPEYWQSVAREENESVSSPAFKAFHNQAFDFLKTITWHYFNHFSGRYLFLNGDYNERLADFQSGNFYIWQLPFMLIGLFWLIAKNPDRRITVLLLSWLMLAPLPSALSRDKENLLRALNFLPALTIIIGFGLWQAVEWLRKKPMIWKFLLVFPYFLFSIFYFLFYLDSYYLHTPTKWSSFWQYGYKEVVEFVEPLKSKYENIYVSTDYGQPYIYFLFYQKYPPKNYQPQASLAKKAVYDVGEGTGYDNFSFRKLYWPDGRSLKKSLFIGPPEQLPLRDIREDQAKLIKTFYFKNGLEAFRIVETF